MSDEIVSAGAERRTANLPRILTIMGSGETAPTMVKVHRSLLDRLGPPPVPAVLLDTPFGFQENHDEITARVVHYFAESLQAPIEVATVVGSDDQFAAESTIARIRDARYLFAGPGSPTYALRKWKETLVPSLLKETLSHGGAVTFSSAAALTIGVSTIPVYEIYKVGEDPFWLEGLDVLSVAGVSAAVIPHYNNAEGGTHDTRFCYMGERRLSVMEKELPEDAFVLGVDEHTALVLDLDERVGSVFGNGVVTVRAAGRSRTWSAGESIKIDDLLAVAEELRQGVSAGSDSGGGEQPGPSLPAPAPTETPSGGVPEDAGSPLLGIVREKEAGFAEALADRDITGAVTAVLDLEADLTAWSHDIPAGDALDRAHASLRSLIVALGRAGEDGVRDPREVVGPFVEELLLLRDRARSERRFEEADAVRDRLLELGVEVRDSPDGSEWLLRR